MADDRPICRCLSGVLFNRFQLTGSLTVIPDTGDYELYAGVYEVTPKPDSTQVLKTTNKILKEDVRVLKIPFYEVSNQQGGQTVIIGGN